MSIHPLFRAGAALALSVLLSACASTSTSSQPPQAPSDLHERVAALGRAPTPDAFRGTIGLYAPLHSPKAADGVTISRDLSYGPDENHRLTVFQSGGSAKPVLLFVHGGGFVAGQTHYPNTPFYDNVGLWAANNGMLGVNMTYRLAPQNPWPAGALDVGTAVDWVQANAERYGGDPSRIFIVGHSAGAVHVASYIAHPRFHGADGDGLAGAILISGLYDIAKVSDPPPGVPNVNAMYFGQDKSLYSERSSLAGIAESKLPIMVVIAGLDLPDFELQGVKLMETLCKRDRQCPRFLHLAGHSHFSEVLAINTADGELLTGQIADFVRRGR